MPSGVVHDDGIWILVTAPDTATAIPKTEAKTIFFMKVSLVCEFMRPFT